MTTRRSRTCPDAAALAKLAAGGGSPARRAHVATCLRCADELAATARVVETFRALPWHDAPAACIEEQRVAVLASISNARTTPQRRWSRWMIPAIAVAAIAVLAMLPAGPTHRSAPPPAPRGNVVAHAAAKFVRIGTPPDEIVRLVDGHLTIEVSPLAAGERFRVVTADAEVEVRGTAFDVVAQHDRLVTVRVWHGRVEVRPAGASPIVLTANEHWDVPAVKTASVTPPSAASGSTSVAPASSPPDRPEPSPTSTRSERRPANVTTTPPTGEPATQRQEARVHDQPTIAETLGASGAAYRDAWQALRHGDFAAAAAGFERAATSEPASSLAEDAWYWRAVALARAGDGRARSAFVAFLDRYPRSPKAGEASAMLGWLLFDDGDLDRAASRFRAAIGDPAPAVRDSAAKGLETIQRRRGRP